MRKIFAIKNDEIKNRAPRRASPLHRSGQTPCPEKDKTLAPLEANHLHNLLAVCCFYFCDFVAYCSRLLVLKPFSRFHHLFFECIDKLVSFA